MPWTATVEVRTRTPELAEWIERSLRPEAAREVPRARANLRRIPEGLAVQISARDSGAMRAALNTYLGWVHLSIETARTASRPSRPRSDSPE